MTWLHALTRRQWLAIAAVPLTVAAAYLAAALVAGMEFIDAREPAAFGWQFVVGYLLFWQLPDLMFSEERKMLTKAIAARKPVRPVRCWRGIRHVRWWFKRRGATRLATRMWARGMGPPAISPSDADALDSIWRGEL